MDEKHGRGSMRDQDREKERKRQETPGRSPQGGRSNTGSRGGSFPNPDSNRPGGGGSSQTPGEGSEKGSRGYPHSEEQEEESER